MTETKKRKYPVGIQDFDDIIERGFVYVDKTAYIHRMVTDYNAVFLSRPRRFGKTMISKTMEKYFQGRRDLFKGLAIDKLEDEWEARPVVRIDLAEYASHNAQQLNSNLAEFVDSLANDANVTLDTKSDLAGTRFSYLIKALSVKAGKKITVLVDEYDSPLLFWMKDAKVQDEVRNVLRGFFQPLKSQSEYIRFIFITGITKFSQVGIFSALNNLEDISQLPEFAAVCGISQKEIETQLADDVACLAEALGKSNDEMMLLLKKKYDGYHFCLPSDDIYNPLSLMAALKYQDLDDYWFRTGTPTFLFDALDGKQENIEFLSKKEIELNKNLFNIPAQSTDTPFALLYQSGYLTLKSRVSDNVFRLGIPNEEVRQAYIENLVQSINPRLIFNSWVDNFLYAAQKADIAACMDLIKEFFAGIGYNLKNKTEAQFQTIFLCIFRMLGLKIEAEYATSRGRMDAILFLDNHLIIFEFKLDRSTQKALDQIDNMDYFSPWLTDKRKKIAVGVNFNWRTRNIGKWEAKEVK